GLEGSGMRGYIVRLDRPPEETTAAAIGGKGANLAALTRAGFPVPPGFAVTVEAWQAFCAAGSVPAPLRRCILDEYARLRTPDGADASVAVRSSATLEDGRRWSFAGTQQTHLDVRGAHDLLTAI